MRILKKIKYYNILTFINIVFMSYLIQASDKDAEKKDETTLLDYINVGDIRKIISSYTKDWVLYKTLERSRLPIDVAFSPDDKYIAFKEFYDDPSSTNEYPAKLMLYNIASEELRQVAEGEKRKLSSAFAFSPNNKYIANAYALIDIFDVNTLNQVHRYSTLNLVHSYTNLSTTKKIISLQYSPDSKLLASLAPKSIPDTNTYNVDYEPVQDVKNWRRPNIGIVKIWEPQRGMENYTLQDEAHLMSYSPVNMNLALLSLGENDADLTIYDTATGNRVNTLNIKSFNNYLDPKLMKYSPNGNQIALGYSVAKAKNDFADVHNQELAATPNIRIFDIVSGKLINSFGDGSKLLIDMKYKPDGKLLATASFDSNENTISFWNTISNKEVYRITEKTIYAINSISFSSDGRFLAAASDDGTIKIWKYEGID